MDIATLYDATRRELLEMGAALDDADTRTMVPALPGWSVKDTYAHLCGLCVDVFEGRLEGAGSPEWSGRQVAERAGATFGAVCTQWAARGAAFDEYLRAAGEDAPMFVAFDVWTHQQDVRGALRERGVRDDERVAYLADRAARAFDGRFRAAGAPSVRVVTATAEYRLGEHPPVATLETDDYELMRILFARRSAAQILGARWDGDPAPALPHLHLFDLPVVDLVD